MVSEKYLHETSVHDIQFFEETDAETLADTIHAPGSGTDATFIAKQGTLSMGVDLGAVPIYGGYGRKPYAIEKTIETAGIAFDFQLRKTKSINFLKYLVNAPVGTGTCDKALSIACKIQDDVGTRYLSVKHARLASGVINCAPGILMASVQISAHYNAFNATIPTNWQWATDPGVTTNPFIRASDGGTANWTLKELSGSTSYTPYVSNAIIQFRNQLDMVPTSDHSSGWHDNPVDRQVLGGTVVINAKATANEWFNIWNELYALDLWDIDWTILSTVHALDINSAGLVGTEIPRPSRIGPRQMVLGIVDNIGTTTLS